MNRTLRGDLFKPPDLPTSVRLGSGDTIYEAGCPLLPTQKLQFVFRGEPPRFLYRYTNDYNADALLNVGSLSLGTLFGYTEQEGLNLAQYDASEGSATFVGDEAIPGTHYSQKVAVSITSLDNWVVCLSSILSGELLDEFEATRVLRVDSRKFCEVLARTMASRSDVGSISAILYLTEEHLKNGQAADFHSLRKYIKPAAGFEQQREYRICFEQRGDRLRDQKIMFARNQLYGDQTMSDRHPEWQNGAGPRFGSDYPTYFSPRYLDTINVTSAQLSSAVEDVTSLVKG